jgi:hypothetical protein
MNLESVQIDGDKGCAVITGRISAIPAQPTDEIFLAHEKLMLEFGEGIRIWPVVDIEQNEDGFFTARIQGGGLYFANLNKSDLNSPLDIDKEVKILRGGNRCGGIIKTAYPLGSGSHNS